MLKTIITRDYEEVANSSVDFKAFDNKTIMVTGATGLIGSLLIKSLLYCNEKHNLHLKIIGCVRNIEKAKEVFKDLKDENSLVFCVCDFRKDSIQYAGDVDYIVHTAAITNSKMMVEYPIDTAMIAINGTNSLLDYAIKSKAKSVVYLSSMEAYGQLNLDDKVNEKQLGYININNPRSSYPESKRMCECLCVAYNSQHNLNVKIVRLAQTFGAGIAENENRVFAQFARSVIEKKDIVLHTIGKSEGNYVYTSDAIIGILLILLKGKSGEIYNLSNENSHMTIKDMAEMVANEIAQGNIKVIYDIPKNQMQYGYAPDTKLWLDATKIKELGWEPKISLKESYYRTIEWLRSIPV